MNIFMSFILSFIFTLLIITSIFLFHYYKKYKYIMKGAKEFEESFYIDCFTDLKGSDKNE